MCVVLCRPGEGSVAPSLWWWATVVCCGWVVKSSQPNKICELASFCMIFVGLQLFCLVSWYLLFFMTSCRGYVSSWLCIWWEHCSPPGKLCYWLCLPLVNLITIFNGFDAICRQIFWNIVDKQFLHLLWKNNNSLDHTDANAPMRAHKQARVMQFAVSCGDVEEIIYWNVLLDGDWTILLVRQSQHFPIMLGLSPTVCFKDFNLWGWGMGEAGSEGIVQWCALSHFLNFSQQMPLTVSLQIFVFTINIIILILILSLFISHQ